MNRRTLLKGASAFPLLPLAWSSRPASAAPVHRTRPSDPAWPDPASWDKLNQSVAGRLIKIQSPLAPCQAAAESAACHDIFGLLTNPYYIRDQAGLTQTSGWVDAWTSSPSAYAVVARQASDVVAAVNFARDNNLRLVVKGGGGGHSYQGTSAAPDSLLIWTREMDTITLHDAFVGVGCATTHAPQPAATIGPGAIWMHTYQAVTTKGGRYVQGGGCATVGVAGLIQSGGFGSFSKNYGTAAAGLLEARLSPPTGLCASPTPAPIPTCSGASRAAAAAALG